MKVGTSRSLSPHFRTALLLIEFGMSEGYMMHLGSERFLRLLFQRVTRGRLVRGVRVIFTSQVNRMQKASILLIVVTPRAGVLINLAACVSLPRAFP